MPGRRWLVAIAGCGLLALVGWQARHLADLVPQAEASVVALGPAGPLVFIGCIVLLSPLFFPDSILGVIAGFAFGLGPGTAYYFAGMYVANIVVFALGRSWLRGPVLRMSKRSPKAQTILRAAQHDPLRLAILFRLIPVNVAFVSYLMGAGHFPWRSILLGNFFLLPHLFLSVYIGHAAQQATALMADGGSTRWLEDGAIFLGLLAAGCIVAIVGRTANRAMSELEAEPE